VLQKYTKDKILGGNGAYLFLIYFLFILFTFFYFSLYNKFSDLETIHYDRTNNNYASYNYIYLEIKIAVELMDN